MKHRKFIFQSSALAAILLVGFVFNACSLNGDAKAVDSKVDEYMNELVKQKRFSGSVLIAKGGKPIVKRSYGMADIEGKIPNTPQTRFRIGVITDQIKAATIMKLKEQGKLNVHDQIGKYLDDCPDAWKSITIHHLLIQSSGIPDYARFPDLLKISLQKMTPASVIALFKDKALDFSPGVKIQPNNSNYLLIGLIIEKVSGMSYIDFMHKTIFEPLGMENTGFAGHGEISKDHAVGYENVFIKAALVDIFPYSASSIYSTVEDLLIWDQSLYSEKFISRQSMDEMFPPRARGYMYGSIIDSFYRKMIFNIGGIPGFSSHFAHFPEEKLSIIIISNLDLKSCPVERANLDLSAIVFGEKYELPKERKAVRVDPAVYDKYTGKYRLGEPGLGPVLIITVTRKAQKLIIQWPDQPNLEIFPVSETKFFPKEFEAEFEFIKDSDGRVTLLVFRRGGREEPLRKLEKIKLPGYKAGAGNVDFSRKVKSHGFDPGDMSKLIGLIEEGMYQNIHSLIIMRGGDLVVEKYFNGYNSGNAHTLQSVSKSFTSALVGIALEKGCLKSTDQKILSFFPQYNAIENLNGRKKRIDIGNLLTMRSGTDYFERGPGSDSPHTTLNNLIVGWDRFYLNRPMATEPGTYFQYDSGGVVLLSAILKSACGMHADEFADKWLFSKLGVTGAYWTKNWEKHPHTGGGLFMKPLDMAKFGLLYLRKGMWNGEQIVPASWIEVSFKMHVDLSKTYMDDYTMGYGYLWWILKPAKEGADAQYIYTARGFMGQRIFVIPEYDMVVVFTAGAITQNQELGGEYILYKHIIPAIRK